MARERTYIMIKPDGVQRGLVGEIIKRFEQKGFKLAALKMTHVRAPAERPRSAVPAPNHAPCSPSRCLPAAFLPQASKELLEKHYADLASKGFFAGLIQYMSSGPVVCMVRAAHMSIFSAAAS